MPDLVADLAPDVFVIAGDVSADLAVLEDTLTRFDGIDCHKLFVPGNHDIWVAPRPGTSSRTKYQHDIPEVCRRAGFHFLPGRPIVIRGVGFAGTIGWYDYSFRDPELDGEINTDTYRAKRYKGRIWADARYARWGATDETVAEEMAAQLASDLDDLQSADVPIVVVSHHLPFEDLVVRHMDNVFDFFSAFLGSNILGDAIRARPNVKLVICGHTHFKRDTRVNGMQVVVSPLGYERERPEGVEEALRHYVGTAEITPDK